jgi:UPF0271 protein
VISPLGDRAIRIERPAGISARALWAALKQRPHVADVVVTEDHVAIHFEVPVDSKLEIDSWIADARSRETSLPAPREHLVPVVYDGEDLEIVAERVNLTRQELIERHAGREYTVKMIGFLPGFAYLGDVDPSLVLPRMATPRTRVPAMSLAMAGPYTAVYPFSSPGGWHLIGHATAFPTFQLELGDRVRFLRP